MYIYFSRKQNVLQRVFKNNVSYLSEGKTLICTFKNKNRSKILNHFSVLKKKKMLKILIFFNQRGYSYSQLYCVNNQERHIGWRPNGHTRLPDRPGFKPLHFHVTALLSHRFIIYMRLRIMSVGDAENSRKYRMDNEHVCHKIST